ncbi:hypothetical protein Droror1_Dr00028182 [Drosera rotundifolia]
MRRSSSSSNMLRSIGWMLERRGRGRVFHGSSLEFRLARQDMLLETDLLHLIEAPYIQDNVQLFSLTDVVFKNFEDLIFCHELAVADDSFKSLPVPVIVDDEGGQGHCKFLLLMSFLVWTKYLAQHLLKYILTTIFWGMINAIVISVSLARQCLMIPNLTL